MDYGLSVVRTRRGRRIEVTREVAAPARDAWALLVDVTRWADWGPSVTAVDYAGRRLAADTAGRVQVLWLLWVPFEVVTVETGRWTWRVWGLTPPADGHRVDAIADDRCRVALELPLWAVWYLPLCWLALWHVARLAVADPDLAYDHRGDPL